MNTHLINLSTGKSASSEDDLRIFSWFAKPFVQPKKNRQPIRCRFHHSLPAARGDHLEQSVHRVNALWTQNQNLSCWKAETMPSLTYSFVFVRCQGFIPVGPKPSFDRDGHP